MAPRGRPPTPSEVKRKRGTARPDRMASESNVIQLRGATDVPAYPAALLVDGRRLWDQAWGEAIVWLAPASDMLAVELACGLADGVALAREKYLVTRDSGDARAWVALNAELARALSALGFDPTARSRLGVAEVKAASAIDKLLDRQAKRQQDRK